VRSRLHNDLYMNLLAFEQDGSSATVTVIIGAAGGLDLDRQRRDRIWCVLQRMAAAPHAQHDGRAAQQP
jgi:hypothetical protein